MSVTQPSLPPPLSISYDCDVEDGRSIGVDSDQADGFGEVRESFWIRAQFDSPPCVSQEMEWTWEKHWVGIKEMGFGIL